MASRPLRTPFVGVAVVALVALAVADRVVSESGVSRGLFRQEMVTSAPGSAADFGVWYCSEGTSLPGEFAEHSIVVANPASQAVVARIMIFPGSLSNAAAIGLALQEGEPIAGQDFIGRDPVAVTLGVSARSEVVLNLSEVVNAQFTAALVEVDSGTAVVTQRVQGPTGFDVVPCATRAAQAWHFPAGSTRRDARLFFTLFNPFPIRAVAQFSFVTDDGLREPQSLRGVVVPARSLTVVEVTGEVPRFASLSTTINLLAGRIVAGRLQLFDGSDGLEGLTAGPGVPQTHVQWVFANGPARAGIVDHVMLYNPTQQEALVDLVMRFDGFRKGGLHPPFEVTVPPQQRVAVVFDDLGTYPAPAAPYVYSAAALRPSDSGFWVEATSYNGVPIAAERVGAAAATSSPAGVAAEAGVVAKASRHLVAGNRTEGTEVDLVVINPSPDSIAHITVSSIAHGQLTPVAHLAPQEVAPLGRVVVPVNELLDEEVFALLVESSQPVVVSKSLLALSGTGLSSGTAVPYNPISL
ncbi:MAG: hypothetical protein F4138_04090 [Acidimicrobiia bacterium]|nr:hypothetical protein [Acidimicrobiia bacterium]MYC58399.1 hypothetical protein [Acidimicrobiia bacterium]MYG94158.1 hypothetical protein [Acidimicrobiia bacterium]MYI30495.1 hypothetical protein [Acidimicrobiia bacterium]